MTGPQHYAEAERLLAVCAGNQRGSRLDAMCTAAANVHATLALAAATALAACQAAAQPSGELDAWRKALAP